MKAVEFNYERMQERGAIGIHECVGGRHLS